MRTYNNKILNVDPIVYGEDEYPLYSSQPLVEECHSWAVVDYLSVIGSIADLSAENMYGAGPTTINDLYRELIERKSIIFFLCPQRYGREEAK